jgi:uncharacterized membrane protein
MQIEQVNPNKPSFGLVVALFAGVILLGLIATFLLLRWHRNQGMKPPFTRHPTSQLAVPSTELAA